MATVLTRKQAQELSIEERLKLIEMLWGTIVVEEELVPVPDWHDRILEGRLKRMEDDPQEGHTWEEVREMLRERRKVNAKPSH